ncbi:hypothetical protein BC937DRAFT_95400 [Endogone sp. FLAS-F59071]|nr:hypothetical protein BC937DRAFT_95400 [Endogone sp. FLAS-F59071]|eukprot:RUS20351.1 hypothetical protein BC937DRAFT_95400 [Endogone sp. FLAS-F59071]
MGKSFILDFVAIIKISQETAFNKQCSTLEVHAMNNKPCLRCRRKKRACDNQRPTCRRCRRANAECVYAEDATAGLSSDLLAMQWALVALDVEITRMKRQKTTPLMLTQAGYVRGASCWYNQDDGYTQTDNQDGSEALLRGKSEAEGRSWTITLGKSRARIEFSNVGQIYEMLARIGGLPSNVHREPASTTNFSVNTQRRHPHTFVHKLYYINHSMDPWPDTKSVLISTKTEETLLDFILWRPVSCGSSNSIVGKFIIDRHTRVPSPYYKAMYYAVGAMNAHHFFVHHAGEASALYLLPADINQSEFGKELAAVFFAKARNLLGDQIFEVEASELDLNTVDTLFCMYLYSLYTKQINLAAAYANIAIRVGLQHNIHLALRDPTKTVIDAEELRNGLMWDWIVAAKRAITTEIQDPGQDTNPIPLNQLFDWTVRPSAKISEEKLQIMLTNFYLAKLKFIRLGDIPPARPTQRTLDWSVNIFERWLNKLPQNLHPSSLEKHWRSRFCFIRTVGLILEYYTMLIELYMSYLRFSQLPPAFVYQVEHDCSGAAIMATRLLLTYVRYGGCTFPINTWKELSEAHMRLGRSTDEETAQMHQTYILRMRAIPRCLEVREYLCFDKLLKEYDFVLMALEKNDNNEGARFNLDGKAKLGVDWIDSNNGVDLFDESFVPKKMPGVDW